MSKNERQHGLRVTVTIFIPYDRTNPASIQKAAESAQKLVSGDGLENAEIEKHLSIPAVRPMPAAPAAATDKE